MIYIPIDIMKDMNRGSSFFLTNFFYKEVSFVSRPVVSIVMKCVQRQDRNKSDTLYRYEEDSRSLSIADIVTREVSSSQTVRMTVLINRIRDLLIVMCCKTHHGRTYGHRCHCTFIKICHSAGICDRERRDR